jgi:hypothetical protein
MPSRVIALGLMPDTGTITNYFAQVRRLRCPVGGGGPFATSRPAAMLQDTRLLALSAPTGDGSQMIIASSSITAIPITSTATATGS